MKKVQNWREYLTNDDYETRQKFKKKKKSSNNDREVDNPKRK